MAGPFGYEYVHYDFNLQDLADRSSTLYSDESLDRVLRIVQMGPEADAGIGHVRNFHGVAAFEVCARLLYLVARLTASQHSPCAPDLLSA